MAHTPGPWTVELADGALVNAISPETGLLETVATVWDDVDGESWEANTRLIAAAPKLLEALG